MADVIAAIHIPASIQWSEGCEFIYIKDQVLKILPINIHTEGWRNRGFICNVGKIAIHNYK